MKKFHQSKTIWFNGLTVLVVIATFLGYAPNTEIAEQATATLLALAPLVNLALRYVSKEAIK